MGKVAIVTDSNSGITQEESKKLGIHILPMPFYINGELFYEDITLSQEEFYKKTGRGCRDIYLTAISWRCDGFVGRAFEKI